MNFSDFKNKKQTAIEDIQTDNFLLSSEEVSEFISSRPSILVRWGISIFLSILLSIIVVSWFIQYPDVVTAKAKLTSINSPKEVRTKTSGKMIALFASENKLVVKSEILGYMESRSNPNEVIGLSVCIDSLQLLLNSQRSVEAPFCFKPHLHLGEVQEAYQIFVQAAAIFEQYLNSGFYARKKTMLQKDLYYLRQMKVNLVMQREKELEDLGLQQENFKANEYLRTEKVISAFEYRSEKSKLIAKQLIIPTMSSTILANENSFNEKQKEIMELDNQIAQQKNIYLQALSTFKVKLDEWKAKYLLVAPVTGRVAFSTFLQENQELQSNQTICYINPENSTYFAEVFIAQNNFGKVKETQTVLLQFPSYSYAEYGKLEGKLEFISNIPTDSGYLAKVILPRGLRTNYNKDIQYREGLSATAQIITKDIRLLERFYFNLKTIVVN